MNDFTFYLCCFFSFLLILCKLLLSQLANHNQPPSPFALPIIGHLHLIKGHVHKSLLSLSHQYGPVFLLRFGCRNVLVVSSSAVVEECFTTNDIVFANRPHSLAGQLLGLDYTTINWAPYGQHWRNLRRLTTTEIFSSNRVLMSSGVRQEEIKCMIKQLYVRRNSVTNFNSVFFELMFNVMNQMVVGEQILREDMKVGEKEKLKKELRTVFLATMAMNLVDFFPVLKWFGFLGLEKKVVQLKRSRDEYLKEYIAKGKSSDGYAEGRDEKKTRTLRDSWLSLQKAIPEYHTDVLIKSLITMMFAAGTDTSASTMEWAMALLLNHPNVLRKAREEIDSNVPHDRLLEDSDLSNLPYLHCIINETFRLHPVGPLLLPHAASEDCVVGGYKVKRGTMLIVNAWAIHRDPKLWVEPDRFKPERFLVEGEKEGFKFIPFGAGRRRCPGALLAMRMMALALGALIQCFEWERMGKDLVDMTERGGSGSTMSKAEPLEAICSPREVMLNLLSQL